MTLTLRKSAAALLAALLFASSASGCFKIQKIDDPASPGISDPVTTPATDPATDPTTDPSGEPEPENPGTDTPAQTPAELNYDLLKDAIALGLMGNGTDYLEAADGLWNVIGYYAALLARIGDRQMGAWLSDAECDALRATLIPDGPTPELPARWFSDGGVVREEMSGVPGVSFPSYEEMLMNTLGIWRELRHPTEEDAPYAVEVVDHLDDGDWQTFVYIAFAEDPSDGRTKLVYLVIGDTMKMTPEGALSFTLDDLRAQNRLSSLLSVYDSVTLDMSDEYSTDYQSLWLRDGDMVFYETSEISMDDEDGEPMTFHSENGAYRGFEFNTYLAAEPMVFVWVTADPRQPDTEYYESLLTRYIPAEPASDPVLVSEDEDTCTFTVDEVYETLEGFENRMKNYFTVDKGTLAILSCVWEYEDGSMNGFTVSYNGEKLGTEPMKAWDKTRRLDIDIRTEAGEPRVDTAEIPDAWLAQLLTDEGITVYTDEACTELTYNLIDAGGDTILYARDAANTPAGGEKPDSGEGTNGTNGTDGLSGVTTDLPGFAIEDVFDLNYITVLVKQFGQVAVRETYGYGSAVRYYFPWNGTIVSYSEGEYEFDEPAKNRLGFFGDVNFEIDEAGQVMATSYIGGSDDPAFLDAMTDPEGNFFSENTRLNSVLYNSTMEDLTEGEDTYSFRAVPKPSSIDGYEYQYSFSVTVEKGTLAIRSVSAVEELSDQQVEYGEDIVPFAPVFEEAMKDTRTLTYHVHLDGENTDYTFVIPKSWPFTLGLFDDDARYFRDKGLTDPTVNLIPADNYNHEIWVTDARG
ncbi:MAG: hypothetical protein II680_12980 [Clostridia bacterium]|nr:hypothetical protein [Clostridia bacterium]